MQSSTQVLAAILAYLDPLRSAVECCSDVIEVLEDRRDAFVVEDLVHQLSFSKFWRVDHDWLALACAPARFEVRAHAGRKYENTSLAPVERVLVAREPMLGERVPECIAKLRDAPRLPGC